MTEVWKYIVRPIAIGGMLVGAGYTLFRMRKSLSAGIARSVSDVKKAATGGSVTTDRIDRDIPFNWIMVGIAVVAIATSSILQSWLQLFLLLYLLFWHSSSQLFRVTL